jgi:para-nitrobenzyl esterase
LAAQRRQGVRVVSGEDRERVCDILAATIPHAEHKMIARRKNPRASADTSASIGRRDFLGTVSSIAGAGFLAPAIIGALGDRAAYAKKSASTANVVVKTNGGQLGGVSQDGVISFKGVRYGESPAGENRFKPPVKVKPWNGVREAIAYGPQAIQARDPGWSTNLIVPPTDEDCLFLNIWTQGVHDGRKRPVMFYSHGGGWNTGNGGAPTPPGDSNHDGTALAKNYDVVFVTHNHRLNLLGFLYLGDILGEEYAASGCAGVLDIQAALQWVVENIAAFGGDPTNIMIFGESGGGYKTTTLTAMPGAHGMFQKASVESGSAIDLTPKDRANETAHRTLERLGLTEKTARDLVKMPLTNILDVISVVPSGTAATPGRPLAFSPVVDGHYIPANPYDPVAPPFSKDIPMIIGTNKDEALLFLRGNKAVFTMDDAGLRQRVQAIFHDKADRVLEVYHRSRPNASPTDLLVAIQTAQMFRANAIKMAERKTAQNGAPVYMYQMTYESEVLANDDPPYPMKASHAMEMALKFDHPNLTGLLGNRPERFQAAANMSHAWTSFARNSDPNFEGLPHWPPYTLEKRETMFINAQCEVVDDPDSEERRLWSEL